MLAGFEAFEVVADLTSAASQSAAVAVADLGYFAVITFATELGAPRCPLNLLAIAVADDFVFGKGAIE